MKKTIHICDRCNAEKITNDGEKAGYRTIQMGISEVDNEYPKFDSYYNSGQTTLTKIYLCNKCLKKFGITGAERPKVNDRKSTSEQLVDLFTELLQERVEEMQ